MSRSSREAMHYCPVALRIADAGTRSRRSQKLQDSTLRLRASGPYDLPYAHRPSYRAGRLLTGIIRRATVSTQTPSGSTATHPTNREDCDPPLPEG